MRGQASICKFTHKCTGCDADADYTEAVLRDVLCRGLEDADIQMDLLQPRDDVGADRRGKGSRQTIGIPPAATTSHRCSGRQFIPKAEKTATTDKTPGYLHILWDQGAQEKPPNKDQANRAYGTKCNHCDKDHHFEKVCRVKNGTKTTEHGDAIFDNPNPTHHIFDQFTKGWLRRQSKPQPFVRLRISVEREDYNHFGFTLKTPRQQSFVSALADTGCQSCLAGLKIVKKLGLSTKDLIPVALKMHAADNHYIHRKKEL